MGVLDGKTAAITGGGGALGRAYARAIAQAGAAIAVSDVNPDTARVTADLITKTGGKALAMKVDATDAAAFEALFDRAEAELGPLDILVNVAGMYPRTLVEEMSEQEWDQVIQLNLKSVFLGTRAAIRRMRPRRRGVILSVASGVGVRGAARGAHYAASKAGIIAFTRSVSLELRDSGIRINCIGPGATDSALWRIGRSDEEIRNLLAAGNILQPEEFANAVVWLVSDQSKPLSGEFIARDPHRGSVIEK